MITVEEYVFVKKALATAVPYCISCKNGHYYRQDPKKPGEDRPHQTYIPRCDEDAVVGPYLEKKKLKLRRREINAEINTWPSEKARDFRQRVKLYEKLQDIDLSSKKSQMVDGQECDSKSEMILINTLKQLGISYRYQVPVSTRVTTRIVDLVVGMKFWEHEGMTSKPGYAARQLQKHKEYAAIGLKLGENFMVTTEVQDPENNQSYLKMPTIIWKMVQEELVSARKVLNTYFRKPRPAR